MSDDIRVENAKQDCWFKMPVLNSSIKYIYFLLSTSPSCMIFEFSFYIMKPFALLFIRKAYGHAGRYYLNHSIFQRETEGFCYVS